MSDKNTDIKKAVFIDRDGVLNKSHIVQRKPFSPRTYKEFQLLPNIKEALSSLIYYETEYDTRNQQ